MISKAKRQAVFDKSDGRCAYCRDPITTNNFQVDHIVAKCMRGSDDISNLRPSCRRCNNYKRWFTTEEFRMNIRKAIDVQRRSNPMFHMLERFGIIKQVKTEVVFHFEDAAEITKEDK